MNASPDAQLRLLDLQALDSGLDRLEHRRRTLPELAQLAAVEDQLARLQDALVLAETEDSDLGREQDKLEHDVDLVRARAARDQDRLDAGSVGSPRELENLQSEIASLSRRQGGLEEQVLEVMERREAVQARAEEMRVALQRLGTEEQAISGRRDEALAEISGEQERLRGERVSTAGELPADLLSLYEKVRADKGGVGAAALLRGRCEGCHLTLSGSDLAAIRSAPPDAVLRCEECRRILVRTPESGL